MLSSDCPCQFLILLPRPPLVQLPVRLLHLLIGCQGWG